MSDPDIRATEPVPAGGPAAQAPATDQQSAAAAGPPAPTPYPHAGMRYAFLRMAMFVTVGGLLYLIGLRGWLLLFLAVIVSAIVSFFVFLRQREAAARNLEASVEHWQARHHAHPDEPEGEQGTSAG